VAYATGGSSTPTARVDMAVDDILVADDVRKQVAALRGANVATFDGSYMGFIHPDVSYDFRSATDVAAWRTPANYVNPEGIYNGEIGKFESVRFIETARAKVFTNVFDGSMVHLVLAIRMQLLSWVVRLLLRRTAFKTAMVQHQRLFVAMSQTS
jgi:N4-gp56 family major capsid protein